MSRGVTQPGDYPPPYSAATAPAPGFTSAPTPGFASAPAYKPYQEFPPVTTPIYPQHGYQPTYGATSVPQTTTIIVPPEVIMVGGCPACRIGILQDDYTCLGVLCAILFFPIGILCCLALKNRRCSNCGAYFG